MFLFKISQSITILAILLCILTSCRQTQIHDNDNRLDNEKPPQTAPETELSIDSASPVLPNEPIKPTEEVPSFDTNEAQHSFAIDSDPKQPWITEVEETARKIAAHVNLFEDYSTFEQAKTDSSGITTLIIKQDSNGKALADADFFQLHYSLWDENGKLLSSTYYTKEGKQQPPKVLSWDDNIPKSLKNYLQTAQAPAHVHLWVPPSLSKYELPFYVNGKPIERGLLMYDIYLLDTFVLQMPPKEIPENANQLEDGLAWRVISQGNSNESIQETDLIQFDYTTWDPQDGKRIFSTLNHTQAVFSPSGVPKDWRTLLPKLHPGDIAQIWVPANYVMEGDDPKIQEISIHNIVVKAPKDLSNPQHALISPSGIPYLIVEPGTENTQPTANSIVSYHDSEWFCQQELCKSVISTYQREMKTHPLAQTFPIHREMLSTMNKGEKRLVWFSDDPNRPGVNTSGILSPHLLELVDFN